MPGGSDGKPKTPASLLVLVRVALVPTFVALTVAPTITAPELSRTSPDIPPSVWLRTGAIHASAKTSKQSNLRIIISPVEPWSWCFTSVSSPRGVLVRIRSEEHTSELQSLRHLVCRLL